jgi:hypothetical protein
LLSVVLTGVFVSHSDAGPPPLPPFNPTYVPSITSPVEGAHTDITVNFSMPANNFNFSAVIGFVPDDMGVGTCATDSGGASLDSTCADDMIPNGALIGSVVADATLGLANAACNSTGQNPITWSMMEATTDMGTTVIFEDDPVDADNVGEMFEDADSDGIPNGAEAYPELLTRLVHGPQVWDAMDPGSAPLQPMLRSYGQTIVAGTNVGLQFLLMEPGITVNGLALPADAGYPLITVLQNIGDPGAITDVQAISDNCTPLTSLANTFGVTRDNPASPPDEGGVTVLTIPSPATYEAHALLFSNRDEDGDNVENQMDTCPTVVNVGNPTIPLSGDADNDGLDAACDPSDSTTNADQDGDNFENRLDNCPQASNGPPQDPTAQDDVDRDGIGNVCDPAPTTPSALINAWPPSYLVNGDTFLANVVVSGPVMGDTGCSTPIGTVNSVDALQVLRRNASLEPYGACANNAEADVDCSGSIGPVDALKILRHVAGLSVVQIGPEPDACPDIGTALP